METQSAPTVYLNSTCLTLLQTCTHPDATCSSVYVSQADVRCVKSSLAVMDECHFEKFLGCYRDRVIYFELNLMVPTYQKLCNIQICLFVSLIARFGDLLGKCTEMAFRQRMRSEGCVRGVIFRI